MMEKKYQHMMEQVNMDEGFASGLLEQIQAERPQKRPQPLRTALIAACVCLALVGTAVAANSDVVRQYFGTILLANEEEYDKMIEEMEETIWDRGNDAPAALPGLSAPSGKIERRTPGNNRAEWIENKTRSWENRLSLSSVSGSDSSVIDVAADQKEPRRSRLSFMITDIPWSGIGMIHRPWCWSPPDCPLPWTAPR